MLGKCKPTKGMPVRPHPRPTLRELPQHGHASNHRGVWEEHSPFPNMRSFAVVAEDGRIAEVTALAEIVDHAFLAGLERLLDRYRPRKSLKAV